MDWTFHVIKNSFFYILYLLEVYAVLENILVKVFEPKAQKAWVLKPIFQAFLS